MTETGKVRWREIVEVYLLNGVDGLDDLWGNKRASRRSMRRALGYLRGKSNDKSSDFVAWYVRNVGPVRGLGPEPVDGERRSLSVQQTKVDAMPWARTPIPFSFKGDDVVATFYPTERRIVIEGA